MEKSKIAYRKIIKVLAVIAIIFFFIPAFMVSCGAQDDISVSAVHVIAGYRSSVYGQITEPTPYPLFLLLMPIIILIIACMKKWKSKAVAAVEILVALINIGMWVFFRMAVHVVAEENYCNDRVTFGYYVDILAMVAVILFSGAILFGIVLEKEGGIQTKVPVNVNTIPMWQCPQCGKMEYATSRFCGKCGTEQPQGMMENIEKRYCPSCGKAISSDSKFCMSCGSQIE